MQRVAAVGAVLVAVLAALAVLPSLQSLLSCCPCSPADCVSQRHYSLHIQAVLAVPQPAQSLQSMRFAGIHALGSGDSHRWQVYHAKKYQGVFYKFEDAVAAKASAMNITPAELKKRIEICGRDKGCKGLQSILASLGSYIM